MNNLQTTFSNAFSSIKMFEFRLNFQWSMFPKVQLTIFQHWFRWWLGAVQATSHYMNQIWLVYRRIYASLGLNVLNDPMETDNTIITPFRVTRTFKWNNPIQNILKGLQIAFHVDWESRSGFMWRAPRLFDPRYRPVILKDINGDPAIHTK